MQCMRAREMASDLLQDDPRSFRVLSPTFLPFFLALLATCTDDDYDKATGTRKDDSMAVTVRYATPLSQPETKLSGIL